MKIRRFCRSHSLKDLFSVRCETEVSLRQKLEINSPFVNKFVREKTDVARTLSAYIYYQRYSIAQGNHVPYLSGGGQWYTIDGSNTGFKINFHSPFAIKSDKFLSERKASGARAPRSINSITKMRANYLHPIKFSITRRPY